MDIRTFTNTIVPFTECLERYLYLFDIPIATISLRENLETKDAIALGHMTSGTRVRTYLPNDLRQWRMAGRQC